MQETIFELLQLFPRLDLAKLPSPVFEFPMTRLPASSARVYVKHDGVCATGYAGNKVRKLEFLLAEAQRKNAQHVVTLGAAGSNHAVATSTYARQLGMQCTVCMSHQPPSPVGQKNLRRHIALGTKLHVFPRFARAVAHAEKLASQPHTALVPLGGSSPLASLGYVAAIDELAQQISEGALPCPQRIYVACGTMGTAVGMALGVALLNLPIQVVAVRVTETVVASPKLCAELYAQSVDAIKARAPKLTLSRDLAPQQLMFVEDFFGNAYAEPTPQALEAIDLAAATGLKLDGTYTGKAFAALLAHRSAGELAGPVLFWCTLNAMETEMADTSELATLGPDFARYC